MSLFVTPTRSSLLAQQRFFYESKCLAVSIVIVQIVSENEDVKTILDVNGSVESCFCIEDNGLSKMNRQSSEYIRSLEGVFVLDK